MNEISECARLLDCKCTEKPEKARADAIKASPILGGKNAAELMYAAAPETSEKTIAKRAKGSLFMSDLRRAETAEKKIIYELTVTELKPAFFIELTKSNFCLEIRLGLLIISLFDLKIKPTATDDMTSDE